MVTDGKRSGTLEIIVVDVDRDPVDNAEFRTDAGTPDRVAPGRYRLLDVRPGQLSIFVHAAGVGDDERSVDVDPGPNRIDFVLADASLPFFWRRGGRVPFRSRDNQLGVAVEDEEGDRRLEAWAAERNLEVKRPYGPRFGLLEVEPDRLPRYAAALRALPGVVAVGRLVNPTAKGTGMLTGQIVVKTVSGTKKKELRAVAKQAGSRLTRKLVLDDLWVVKAEDPDGLAPLATENLLKAAKIVVAAEVEVAFTSVTHAIKPADVLYEDQWHLRRVRTPQAWQYLRNANPGNVNNGDADDRTFGRADIIIGVVDTGVESVPDPVGVAVAAHPEFQGNVTDGRPKVVQFFDFGAMVPSNHVPTAAFLLDGEHGTQCAGVAAARAENLSTVAGEIEGGVGAAPNCRVLAVQGAKMMPEIAYSDMYLWLTGIDPDSPHPRFPDPPRQGADVITNSWGAHHQAAAPISTLMDATLTKIADAGRDNHGTLMFFAVGNEASQNYPFHQPYASHPRTFGIGAATRKDVKADYSNWGEGIDLCASSSGDLDKGDVITTTLLTMGNRAGHTGGHDDYAKDFGGTSAATALAAGVAALVLSRNRTLKEPQVRDILCGTAKRIDLANSDPQGLWRDLDNDGQNEYSSWYGYGLINAAAAVKAAGDMAED
ncbi:S8 family serine peptidase [Actinoplanes solisilvae]|uniref:S8 family serine peptidase n=1 Tax=Actinoplanes solisilvae TaxID=2486853 RepID=UPI000FD81EC7|nr:S8 family serine peptidase [Actinoplanes solisilvae]